MTIPELFALPAGRRLRWAEAGLSGVVEHTDYGLRIVWSGGLTTSIVAGDPGPEGFVRDLSLVVRPGQPNGP